MKSAFFFLLVIILIRCGGGASHPQNVSPLYSRGEAVYKANCISCHHPDPSKNGSLGPAVKGSSEDLIKARLLDASYPHGYKPKRESHLMPPMPHLVADVTAIFTFLNQ